MLHAIKPAETVVSLNEPGLYRIEVLRGGPVAMFHVGGDVERAPTGGPTEIKVSEPLHFIATGSADLVTERIADL